MHRTRCYNRCVKKNNQNKRKYAKKKKKKKTEQARWQYRKYPNLVHISI